MQFTQSQWKDLSNENKRFYQGLYGELALNRQLNQSLGAVRFDGVRYHQSFLFDRLHVPIGNGKTTEIDAVLVCQQGVFVFEVKSWTGQAIMGTASSKTWFTAKSVQKGQQIKSIKTSNPVKQNIYHSKMLSAYLPENVRLDAFYWMVLLIRANPFIRDRGLWQGEDINGLFTDPRDIVETIQDMPVKLSGKRVFSIAKTLSELRYGEDFKSLKLL